MLPPIETFKIRFGTLRYFMAPMAGITDIVFRMLIREMGAQVVISELISAEALVRGSRRTLDLMTFSPEESPIGIQLFGSRIDTLAQAASIVEQTGVDFVDLNLGCPIKKVVCDGAGAAWLKDPIRLGRLLSAMKKAISIPLTIKVRTGWDESSKNVREVVSIAADCGVSWVVIHGRTRAQGYSGASDWELIRGVAQVSPVPIIGNGDILTAQEAENRISDGYAHAVMIGRGALKNPWLFQELLGQPVENRDFLKLIHRHFELAIQKKDRPFLSLKKFLGWYAAGLPHASDFRRNLFGTEDVEALRGLAISYFSSVEISSRRNDSRPFLMGGHG